MSWVIKCGCAPTCGDYYVGDLCFMQMQQWAVRFETKRAAVAKARKLMRISPYHVNRIVKLVPRTDSAMNGEKDG